MDKTQQMIDRRRKLKLTMDRFIYIDSQPHIQDYIILKEN